MLKRDLLFKRRTLVDLLRAAVRVAVSIPLALTVGGAISIAAGIVVSELAALVLLMVLEPVRPVLRMDRATVRSLLGFGGQVTVIRILGSVRSNVDYLVVGGVLGASALGIYGMAYKLPEMGIENVLWIFSGVALAAYSRAYAKGGSADHHHAQSDPAVGPLRTGRGHHAGRAGPGRGSGAVLRAVGCGGDPDDVDLPQPRSDVDRVGQWRRVRRDGRLRLMIVLDVPATAAMVVAFVLVAHIGLVGVAAVHLAFNAVYCVARLILLQRVTGVRGRDLADTVMPALAVAGVTAAVGLAVRSVLRPLATQPKEGPYAPYCNHGNLFRRALVSSPEHRQIIQRRDADEIQTEQPFFRTKGTSRKNTPVTVTMFLRSCTGRPTPDGEEFRADCG